jgi:large conductance mechanosensitive channel
VGGIDFKGLQIILKEGVGEAPPVALRYGVFFQTVLDFTIQAFAIFMFIKLLNAMRRKDDATHEAPKLTLQETLLTEIRDLLKGAGTRPGSH